MTFNIIDALIILVILLSIAGGWYRGFVLSLLDLLRWLFSLLAALFLYQTFAGLLIALTGWTETWSKPIAFLLIFFVVGFLIQLAGNYLLRRLPPDIHAKQFNRILGALPGFVNGLVTAAIFSALFFSMPVSDNFQESMRESALANRLAVLTENLEAAFEPIFGEAVNQTMNRLTIHPESNESVELPFSVKEPRPRPDLEAAMLEMVNQERINLGLEPLEADPELVLTARKHSADMFARSYFSHNTPENKTPFDRMREDKVRFLTAGENLALAPTLPIAHTGLMNSPGHRANILNPKFGRLGIGILDGGRHGLMVTQNFRN